MESVRQTDEELLYDPAMRERVRRAMRCAGELLLALGMPPHTKGFRLLQWGMVLLCEQPPTQRVRICDTLYPLLEEFAGTKVSAEHAIRETIRIRAQRAKPPLFRQLFPGDRVPSNAEFLYTAGAYLRKQLREQDS